VEGRRVSWRDFERAQRVVELDDRFLAYVDEGRGDPVVLVHGIPTWGFVWHRVLPELARARRVIVPDLLGYGFSDKADRFDRSIARQAEALEGLLARLAIDRATVVGHDVGGGAALRLAALFPRRVARLVLVDTVAYDAWPLEALIQLGHPATNRLLGAPALARLLGRFLRAGFAARPPRELIDGLLAPYTTEVGKLSLIRDAAALDTNHTTELEPLLARIHAPTLVVWGDSDPFHPAKHGEWLARDLPRARLVRIPRARHFVMLDQPGVFAGEVAHFLDEAEPAAGRAAA
jgi:pimeloyl-ACP methyl ester carboxylesterase